MSSVGSGLRLRPRAPSAAAVIDSAHQVHSGRRTLPQTGAIAWASLDDSIQAGSNESKANSGELGNLHPLAISRVPRSHKAKERHQTRGRSSATSSPRWASPPRVVVLASRHRALPAPQHAYGVE
jgi:hypothetical protein